MPKGCVAPVRAGKKGALRRILFSWRWKNADDLPRYAIQAGSASYAARRAARSEMSA